MQRGRRNTAGRIFPTALKSLHNPQITEAPSLDSPARLRLAYDELLANQLALSLVRGHMKRAAGRSFVGDGARQAKIISALPYKLTGGQTFANAEIQADMASPSRMLRLLQGDVGSGKTIVALLALATAVECGAQGTFMVPTEILARQHLASLTPLCAAAGIIHCGSHGPRKGQAAGGHSGAPCGGQD